MKKIVLLALATFVFGSVIQSAYAGCTGKSRSACKSPCSWSGGSAGRCK